MRNLREKVEIKSNVRKRRGKEEKKLETEGKVRESEEGKQSEKVEIESKVGK